MFIALEGHSYSGKTTLLNYLRDKGSQNAIAEHDYYAGGIENYPPFPPTNFQMAKNNVDFFAGLEVKRAFDASQLKGDVFFDRSFMSVILFQKFMKSLAVEGQYEAYDYAKDLFFDLLQEKKVAFPDFVAFVACEPEDYVKRQSREISVGLLRSQKALEFFTKEYDKICSVFEKYGRLQKLISKDGAQSLEESRRLISVLEIDSISEDKKQQIITEIMETI